MDTPIFRFFHDQLPDDRQRTIYDAMEAGIRIRQREIICPRILEYDEQAYKRLLEHVYDDHPEMFFFHPLLSTVTPDGLLMKIRPFYRYSAETQHEYEVAVEAAVTDCLSQCFPDGWRNVSELRREKILFDWLTRNITYDHLSIEDLDNERWNEHARSVAWNAYGALVCREAVCEGIACTFKLLCDRVELPCIVVLGRAGKDNGRHAWNIVRINKKFYHVDCTWDLRSDISLHIPYARYRYFNLPDRIIYSNHQPEPAFLPKCGSLQYNPFRMRDLCAADPEELFNIALRMIGKGENRFAVMTIGFRAQKHGKSTAEALLRYCPGEIRWYEDDSGFFIGFDIKRQENNRKEGTGQI